MNQVTSKSKANLQADIVVVGGGGAGLAAAVAAREAGAKEVILIETRRVPGGNSVFPGGIFAAETTLQKSLHIDARKEVLFKKLMDFTHWKTNPRLVRALIDKSDDSIRWLEKKGVQFTQVLPHLPNQVPATYHTTSGPERTGAAIVKALVRNCEESGVRILCQTTAKRLLADEKGNVAGILATTKGGEVRIKAKSIILATGGFAGNKRLLKKYLPTYNDDEVHHTGLRHKGDGLRMAAEIGAAIDGMVTLEMEGPDFPQARPLGFLVHRSHTVWVNNKGERFTDESVPSIFDSANPVYKQPGKVSYSLFDEKVKQIILEEGLDPHEAYVMGRQGWPEKVEEALRTHSEKGTVKIANSWSEVARWIGVAPAALEHTVEEYNAYCDKGQDDIFAKDRRFLLPLRNPPFYAAKCCLNLITTHGGIKVNQNMEALNQEDNPIKGLYAAGVEIGGTDSDTYSLILTGHSFGFAINGGRIAGENAARYASGK